MVKPAQDEENKTVVIFLRELPNIIWMHTKTNGLFQKKIQIKQVTAVPHLFEISNGIQEHRNFRGPLKRKSNFHSRVHKKVMSSD